MRQRAGIVGAGAAHEPERVHRSWRATRKGVETREDLYELAAGRASLGLLIVNQQTGV